MTVAELRERMSMAEMVQWSRWHTLRMQREQLEQAQAEAKVRGR